MGRVGSSYGDALAEPFFRGLRRELRQRNLVKMHDEANSVVMGRYEEIVRGRIDPGERIFYASIPRYEGNNPVPHTIDLHALDNRGAFSRWTVYNTPDGLPPANGVAP